jgi:outer membrane protein OmpA-like peptidoglycan-associated protein
MKKAILVGAVAAAIAGCATAPQRSDQIEQARAQIETLSHDPLAQQAAGKDLDAARKSLQDAETAQREKQEPAVVGHYAYLAQRHAEAGEARVSEARSRQEVARGQDERNKVLLEAREREAQNARSQTAATQAQLASAQQQLAELQAKQTDRGTVVTLSDVLFDTAQATLKPGADLALNRLATYLNGHPQTKVIIEGHTDSRGSEEYNAALSERRARAVATALETRGIPAEQIQTAARGKSFPVASNDTPEGRQQNRRVEIVFSDESGRFAQGDERAIRR